MNLKITPIEESLRVDMQELQEGQTRFMNGLFQTVNELKNKIYSLEAAVHYQGVLIEALMEKGKGK